MIINSFSNPKIKMIRKLDQKKYRQETGLFFIEGLHTVGEAVQTGAPIATLVVAPDLLVSKFGQELLEHPNIREAEHLQVSAEIYQKIAHKQGPQGIGAILRQDWAELEDQNLNSDDFWIALDSVSDPGNLGTIMRTADAVGCQGIILIGNTTDPYDPTAVKASMGALFSLKLVQSTWQKFITWQQENHINLIGTSDHANPDYQTVKYQKPLVLLMGSERHGLTEEMMTACDHLVRIPMTGRSDSLNLAVATGVMLYEIYNQTKKPEKRSE